MINPLTHRRILKKGRPGRAVITAFGMPERGSSRQNLPITLEVHVEGLSPDVVEDQWLVSNNDSLGFGMEVPVVQQHAAEKAAAGAPPAGAGDDPMAKIERLAKLRDSGVLSEEEFERQKSRLLDEV